MKNPKKLFLDAINFYEKNEKENAIRCLEDSLKIDSNYADAAEILGLLYAENNRLDDAIKISQKLADIDPDSVMAHANLSRFYQQKGLIEEAELEQTHARRLSWKAEIKARKAAGIKAPQKAKKNESELHSIEERVQTFKEIIENYPDDVLGYFSLGNVYLEDKQFIEAEMTYQKALVADPEHSPSYVYLGQALEALGKRGEALLTYHKGIKIAELKGDLIPKNKMALRIKILEKM